MNAQRGTLFSLQNGGKHKKQGRTGSFQCFRQIQINLQLCNVWVSDYPVMLLLLSSIPLHAQAKVLQASTEPAGSDIISP